METKASEENVLAKLAIVKGALDHLQGSAVMFNLGDNDDAPTPSSTGLP